MLSGCSYVMDCIRTGAVLENLQDYKVLNRPQPLRLSFEHWCCLGGDHISILLWRVQSSGGAVGKTEVE